MSATDILVQAERVFERISTYLNVVVIALVILLCGFILGKVVESLLRYVFARAEVDERLARVFKARRNYSRAIRRTIVRLIYLATVLLALDRLSLVKPVLTIVLLLGVIIIFISFVLAGLDVVPNIAARAQLRQKSISVGDEVIFTDENGVIQGTIVDMTLTDVRIRQRNGDLFFVPNAVFLKQSVTKKRKAEKA